MSPPRDIRTFLASRWCSQSAKTVDRLNHCLLCHTNHQSRLSNPNTFQCTAVAVMLMMVAVMILMMMLVMMMLIRGRQFGTNKQPDCLVCTPGSDSDLQKKSFILILFLLFILFFLAPSGALEYTMCLRHWRSITPAPTL